MKIDADSGGSVDWNEFMNYMLMEKQTLSKMKQEQFSYIYKAKEDADPLIENAGLVHQKEITCMIIIKP